jgi:hypothetical protein
MGVIMRVPGLMKGNEMKNEYSIYGALNAWFVANKKRIYQEYGLNLSEDKDQWITQFAEEVYELGMAHENEFMTRHERGD